MITLTDVAPYDFSMVEVLSVTFPAGVIGIIVSGLVMMRCGKELDDDPEYQARLRRLAPRRGGSLRGRVGRRKLTYTKHGAATRPSCSSLGVVAIVVFGLFPDMRPSCEVDGETEPIDVTHRSSRW